MSDVTIQNLIESFIQFYSKVNGSTIDSKRPRMVTRADVIHRINSGDCATAAIAIGFVWKELTGEEVIWHDNFDHAFIEIGGVYYDTANPNGSEDYTGMYAYSIKNSPCFMKHHTLIGLHMNYLLYDEYGINMVRTFCKLWKVDRYPHIHYQDLSECGQSHLVMCKDQIHNLIQSNIHLSTKGMHWIDTYLTKINMHLKQYEGIT